MQRPKGYVSAFNFFYETKYRDLKQQQQLTDTNDLNKLIGQQWKQLLPDARIPWIKMGEDDKIRYLKDLAAYNAFTDVKVAPRIEPPQGYDYDGSITEEKPKLNSAHRFQSAYNLFVKQERLMYASFYVGKGSKSAMGKSASLRWKSMCNEEKELYVALEKSHIC